VGAGASVANGIGATWSDRSGGRPQRSEDGRSGGSVAARSAALEPV